MTVVLAYWYMLPLAIGIATLAVSFGIGGAIFFTPLFLLVLNLDPQIAITLGILIEIFGFSSALIGYARVKLINYHLVTRILPFTLVSAILGSMVGKVLPSIFLEIGLALVLFFLAIAFFGKEMDNMYTSRPLHPDRDYQKSRPSWFDFWQDFKYKPLFFATSSIGGLFLGLVSAGLGEINEFNFIKRLKMETGLSAGSSVFIVAITAIVATTFNISFFSVENSKGLETLTAIAGFAIPGVIIGAQLGVRASKLINHKKAVLVLPFLFGIIGALTLVNALL